jgi:hypothetical protein
LTVEPLKAVTLFSELIDDWTPSFVVCSNSREFPPLPSNNWHHFFNPKNVKDEAAATPLKKFRSLTWNKILKIFNEIIYGFSTFWGMVRKILKKKMKEILRVFCLAGIETVQRIELDKGFVK